MEIEKAVENADAVIVCLSNNSVSKEGYIQREIKFVLDIALEKSEGTIFIIPLRLDNCQPHRRLRPYQYVDYFPQAKRAESYLRLLKSLESRLNTISLGCKTDFPNRQLITENNPVSGIYGEYPFQKSRSAFILSSSSILLYLLVIIFFWLILTGNVSAFSSCILQWLILSLCPVSWVAALGGIGVSAGNINTGRKRNAILSLIFSIFALLVLCAITYAIWHWYDILSTSRNGLAAPLFAILPEVLIFTPIYGGNACGNRHI